MLDSLPAHALRVSSISTPASPKPGAQGIGAGESRGPSAPPAAGQSAPVAPWHGVRQPFLRPLPEPQPSTVSQRTGWQNGGGLLPAICSVISRGPRLARPACSGRR